LGPGRSLFESVLVVGNYPAQRDRKVGEHLSIGRTSYVEASNYPLAVLVELGDRPELILVHDVGRFSHTAVESLGRQLVHVLAGFLARPPATVSGFAVAADTDAPIPAGEVLEANEAPIHQLISEAGRAGHAAVVYEDRVFSYGELEERSNRLAWQLLEAGTAGGRLVGLYLPRSIELIVGIVGILKAGCAYVPLDPAYPAAHVGGLLDRDEIGLVVTHSGLISQVPETVTTIDIHDPDTPPERSLPEVGPEDPAYVIHTSGSTGQPKGVMVTHGNLVASTLARHQYYRDPVESFLLLSSFAFDSSVAGIFWTLTSGGTLVLPAPGLEHDAEALASLIEERSITHTLCLPSIYGVLLETAEDRQLQSLEVVVVAGEACPPGLTTSHFARLATAALYNEYGPTEGTVWCTVHRASAADEAFPIGRPIPGARIFLLDDHGNLVPPGFAGEICIAGSGVVPGYLGRPDLTAERFVTTRILDFEERIYRTGDLGAWRRDGVLIYLGRSDGQLKIRGRRLEASAVEVALQTHPAIREAVAVGRSTPDRPATRLVAYVAADSEPLDAEDVKQHLSTTLPEFMVPDILVPLPQIPRLPNGKVDTGSLPDPREYVQRDGNRIAPRNDRERMLAGIWCDLLGLDAVGVRDDFFELGGDSIVSIRMISRARQAGLQISPGHFTRHPTIEQLALATEADSTPGDAVSGPVPLGPIQRWFFDTGLAVPDHWNQSSLFSLDGALDPVALERALQACVQHHDMLRARFAYRDGVWSQRVDPTASVALEVADEGADADEVVAACQQSLDLEAGPVVRAVLITRPPAEPDLLFLAVHHLVIDVVSWGILVDDLERAYLQASTGQDIELPPRSTSYRDWVSYLASDQGVEGEPGARAAGLVSPSEGVSVAWGTERSQQTVTVELEADVTELLLREANDAFRTRPAELMVAALAAALETRSDGPVRLALEGHGRPPGLSGIDLSRTIGWFTAQYPITVPSGGGDDARLITSTKETMRQVPNGGVGYGALRYLHGHPAVVGQPDPEYLFNYVGRDTGGDVGLFRRVSWCDDSSRHPSNERAHRIEIVAAVGDGRLAVEWRFSSLCDDRHSVEGLARTHLERLRDLVSLCMAEGTGGFTPSDFPVAGLDQDELDQFLDGLV
jgi:amino acid adenylation domain-containing protein/non-ribosomal peptide synthase protein (TIGR01720 family)